MRILGIESSCDETSASVVVDHAVPEKRILSNVINLNMEEYSQLWKESYK